MTREEFEACWRAPGNDKRGLIYYCKADPRAIVPRRLEWIGWTVNVARPSAIPVVLLLLAASILTAAHNISAADATMISLRVCFP